MTITTDEAIELQSVIPFAYNTTDYDFATYLLALKAKDGRRCVEIVNIKPHVVDQKGVPIKYAFFLASCDGSMAHDDFHAIRMDYINQKCAIEPTALTMARRQLRSLLNTYAENAGRK